MSGSISDVLTTLKNGVVAINNLAGFVKQGVLLGRGEMPGSYGVFYTVPTGGNTVVTNIDISNGTNATQQIYVSFVPTGLAPGTTNALFYHVALPSYTTLQWVGAQALTAGDTIQAYSSSASDCAIMITGVPV